MSASDHRFDTFVVVDWSGGKDTGPRPRKDAIWAGVVRKGLSEVPVYLRNRQAAEGFLSALFREELAAGRRIFAGFDFPFGYPEGFASRVTGRPEPLVLWDWYAEALEDGPAGNNRFDLAGRLNQSFPGTGPFWFNGLRVDIPGLPRKGRARIGHGMAEKRLCERLAKGAFTCWQMGGAGAVGGQVITGMRSLSRLRSAFPGQIAVWPFEPLSRPIAFVEVWPSLFSGQIAALRSDGEIKDRAQVRVLADHVAAMSVRGDLNAALAEVPAVARAEEGWIFGLSPGGQSG
jgi:molybdopterin molybdotransferase